LFKQGKPEDARKEFVVYLQGDTTPELAAKAREAISYIDKSTVDGP
jgi:hypothetical protein